MKRIITTTGACILICLCYTGLHAQTLKDIDGNVYKTITIGNQLWMAENLKTTKYNDGTSIPLVTEVKDWKDNANPGYCWYNNDQTAYGSVNGALYNGHSISTGKLCPTGWRVPTDRDWDELQKPYGNYAGIQLKEKGTQYWKKNSDKVTNETGFSARGSGYRNATGTFTFIEETSIWWTSTPEGPTKLATRSMWGDNASLGKGSFSRNLGASVRCIKE